MIGKTGLWRVIYICQPSVACLYHMFLTRVTRGSY